MVERTTQSVQESATEAYREATSGSGSDTDEERRTQREATEALEEATDDDGGSDVETVNEAESGDAGDSDSGGMLDIQSLVDRGAAAASGAREAAERQVERFSGGVNLGSGDGGDNGDLSDADRSRRRRTVQQKARAVEADQQTDRRDPFGLQDLDRGEQRRTVGRLRNKATALDRASRAGRQQARQTRRRGEGATGSDTGALGVIGAGGVVEETRAAIDKGVTLGVDEVQIPGTAGRLPIPEQRVNVSGQGLASFSQDVRETTGLGRQQTQPGGGDGIGEVAKRTARGEAGFQQEAQDILGENVNKLNRRRRRAGEGLPDRSLFSVLPVGTAPVTAAVGSGAATIEGAGGATAGGTAAAGGGSAAGGTASGSAVSTTVKAGTALGALGVASGLSRDTGEVPVSDRFGEPELEIGDPLAGAEVEPSAGSDPLGGPELETGGGGPQATEIGLGDVLGGPEISLGETDGVAGGRTGDGRSDITPEDVPLRDDRVNAGGDTQRDLPSLSAGQLFRQRTPLREGDEEFEDDEPVVIGGEDILNRRPEPDQAINNQRIQQDPEVNPTVRGLRQRIEEEENRVREYFQGRQIEFGSESEPEATVDEDPLERVDESLGGSATTAAGSRSATDVLTGVVTEQQQRQETAARPSIDVDVGGRTDIRQESRPRTTTRTDVQVDTPAVDLPEYGTPAGTTTTTSTGNPFTPETGNPYVPETGNPYLPGGEDPPEPPRRREPETGEKKKRKEDGFLNLINERETFDTVSAGEFLGADLFGGED